MDFQMLTIITVFALAALVYLWPSRSQRQDEDAYREQYSQE